MKDKRKEKSKNGILKVIIILLAVIVACVGYKLVASFNQEVSYNYFLQEVQDKKVTEVFINEKKGVVYYLTNNDDNKLYHTNYPYTENFRENLLLQDIEVKMITNNFIAHLGNILNLAITLALLAVILSALKMGNSFNIEYSEDIKTRFEDIGGMHEIKKELLNIANIIKDEKYTKRGAKLPKGLLLQGPPGNGKTLLAKAFAGETGINFIATKSGDFSSSFVGVGSNKIKELFTLAKENAPCVIFIDEIDGIGSKRLSPKDAAGKEMNTILSELLIQMDGFSPNEGIFVLAATNRAEDLDDALLRPGRFDKKLVVLPPDVYERKEIIDLYCKNIELDNNVNIEEIALRTSGCNSSYLQYLVNEAVIISITKEHKKVLQQDFEEALLKLAIKGSIKENYKHEADDKKIIAYHEAGHAVLSHFLCNEKISMITIKPTTSGAGGFTMTEPSKEKSLESVASLKAQIIKLYAGRAAEYNLCGNINYTTTGPQDDIRRATKLASQIISIEEGVDYQQFGSSGCEEIMNQSSKLLQTLWNDSVSAVKKYWEFIDIVAQELIKYDTITYDKFLQIISI